MDKGGKDYNNQLKDLHNKAEELTAEHANRIAQLTGKAAEETARKRVTDLEQSEREKIDATMQGSAARLTVINSAIKAEEAAGLQSTSFYRDLLQQRVTTAQKEAEEEAKLRADAGKEAADNEEKMGALALAAQKEHQQLVDSSRRMTDQQRMAEAIQSANEEYALKRTVRQLGVGGGPQPRTNRSRSDAASEWRGRHKSLRGLTLGLEFDPRRTSA